MDHFLPLKTARTLTKNIKTITIIPPITLILLVLICLKYTSTPNYFVRSRPKLDISSSNISAKDIKTSKEQEKCDIFKGKWVPNPDAPYYTNTTCLAIHEHQNCMKYGRPDLGFMKWKWKPDRCDLPVFNPFQFLDMVRNKSMAFVGDSLGRNHLQSMICLLSRAEYPIDISPTANQDFKRWKYINYNFTLASYWSPFLVRANERDSDGPTHTGIFNLYLDEYDESWTTQIDDFDYLILNGGHWLNRIAVYHENRRPVGCRYCQLPNFTDLPNIYGYRRILRTAFKAINERENFNGVVFLRTLAPSHFENGDWNAGGNCVRQRPFRSNETTLKGSSLDMYMTQLKEFRVAERKGKKRFRLLDVTQAMSLRPDGHPSKYGHRPNENVVLYNDCVHWCLPGPIDTWADLLLHMMKMDARRW